MSSTAASIKPAAASQPARAANRTWMVIALFIFMLLHQTDKLLISPLTTPIMETFGINEAQMGMVFTGALLVGGLFFPLWGYLFDRFARPKILSLAALIWGSTTWLSAIASSFGFFVATRATTGIDDASYPGVYSLVSDSFAPSKRGKVISVLQLTAVIGGILGMGLATAFRDTIGWRGVFIITGSLGVIWALVMFFTLRDVPRGQAEPEQAGRKDVVTKRFSWRAVGALLRKPILIVFFIQQVIYVFPMNAVNSWYFRYLETEGGLTPANTTLVMGLFAIFAASGTFIAGVLGDWAFKRTPRGRILVAVGGMALLTASFTTALRISPSANFTLFFLLQCIGAFFWSFAWPNAVSTIQDIVEPEIRSTAHAVMGIAETLGSTLAPLVAGVLAVGATLQQSLVTITMIGWLAGIALMLVVLYYLPREVRALRETMQARVQAADK
ncbi:MAG TPA: MFS transporter [Anaerolineaceae bacterium]|nr:MFS transporter [Anaerolineaceae bacterium]